MSRKLVYTFSLVGFFVMWGVFGFAAGAPRGEAFTSATLPTVQATVAPQATAQAGIPVTGRPAPVLTEVFLFYGLIGLTALFLVLALLNAANKSTAPQVHHEPHSPDDTQRS